MTKAELMAELESVKEGYRCLDANWKALHDSCMNPIREATVDGTIPEILDCIAALRAANAELEQRAGLLEGMGKRTQLSSCCQDGVWKIWDRDAGMFIGHGPTLDAAIAAAQKEGK